MDPAQLAQIMELVKKAQGAPLPDHIAKSWTQGTNPVSGLTMYDLEAPAKLLYPVLTPLRNTIPRDFSGRGIQANWRAITGINVNQLSAGVAQGQRGGGIATSTQDYTAAFKSIGLEDDVTFEADLAAKGFDDVKARAAQGLLSSLMIQEEKIILGGNGSLALGTTPTPTLAASTTGGTIGTATYSVICVALSLEGVSTAMVGASGVQGQITRTNTDGSTVVYGGGGAIQSAAATVAVTGPSGSLTASVVPVKGAYGYAWFCGTAGAERIVAITTMNSVVITGTASGANQLASAISAPTTDSSTNQLVFDGLLTMCAKNLGSYFYTMPTGTAGVGTPLTSDGAGGIVEIDAALKYWWDNYRLSPDTIWVSSQEQKNISAKVMTASSTSAMRFSFNVDQGMLAGGTMVRSYLNKYGMNGVRELPIKLHPNLPAGTILFTCQQLPYALSNVTDVFKIKGRRDYYQIDWPLRSRKYEYGIYSDEVLQHYFPPSMGVITNIGNG